MLAVYLECSYKVTYIDRNYQSTTLIQSQSTILKAKTEGKAPKAPKEPKAKQPQQPKEVKVRQIHWDVLQIIRFEDIR